MQFRAFTINDFESIILLWKKAGLQISRSDTQEGLLTKLQRDSELFFVMEDDATIIGVVMGSYDGRRGWINHLAVEPAYQGKRIGQQMMVELEARFKQAGCEKVNLLIEKNNASVQYFYEKQGYEKDDLIFMEKWL